VFREDGGGRLCRAYRSRGVDVAQLSLHARRVCTRTGPHHSPRQRRRAAIAPLGRRPGHRKRATLGQQFRAFRESIWGLLLIGLVLGGIYGGIFTPIEAAAVAAVYAFFITVFVYKELRLSMRYARFHFG
jgi:TRAP-type mannitol/chloroaromatic compound transport system permease large subunit